ncbi:MAG: hypothetical protein DRN91_06030 [Candidatus Alkanophagales archaeon]|nr:MAG: hypothetical protein DRN91_06030 [Candidatus Alkanophagales archaeon]
MLFKKVKVRGKDRDGIVLEVRDGFAKIVSDGEEFWYPLSELEEVKIVDRLIKGDLDDPLDFILSMDAYRLYTEYKFNPYVLASSTKIEIFPHQIDEVTLMLDRPRILLADEVGLGKTIVAALVASELLARGLVKKLLFVVPKALVDKWMDELRERFEMNAELLDSTYLKVYGNPLEREEFCFVASMDTLKQDHFLSLLENAEIDLVVVDEAHKLSKGTDRYMLGEVLSNRAKFLYFLTATPHRGDDEDYIARMKLLDPYVTDIESAGYLVIRNLKDDVIDLDGKEVFPPRESKTIDIPITEEERRIHEIPDEFIAKKLELARLSGGRKEINSARFLGVILRKRASSSLHTLKISLENRMKRLSYDESIDVEELIKKLREAEEEFDEAEKERREQEILDRMIHPQEVREIAEMVRKIEELGDKDSKFGELLEMIDRIKSADRDAKIVVFTEYRDTKDYLIRRLSGRYRVTGIDGTMSLEERKRALEYFRDQNGADVMVCTDAAGEGIDMQFCNIEINYDLPWNPTRLEQRMGRVHRIGQERKVYYYNFVIRDTLDGYILSKLLQKIENIKEAMSDRVYDVIGTLITEKDLNDLFEELLKVPKELWESKVRKIEDVVEKRRSILEKIDRLVAGYRLDRTKLEDIRKIGREAVDEREVKRFVEVFVNHRGGKVEKLSGDIYKVVLPRDLAQELNKGVITGTFSRKTALKTTYPYLALGNKVVMAMLCASMKDGIAAFKQPFFKGLLFFYKISILDGIGQERFGKFVGITEEGKPVNPKIIWDLDPVEKEELSPPSIVNDAMNRAEESASKLALEVAEGTSKKFEEIKEKTKQSIVSYYSNEISKLSERIREYEQKLSEAPHYTRLIKGTQTRIKRLKDKLMDKLKEIDEIYELQPYYELVGVAYVIPEEGYDTRRSVELAGMRVVLEYEYKRAKTDEERAKIRDVSHEFRGYDIESFDRVIEVKSFKTTGVIELTSNEWIVASRMGDYYWLYVVECALDDPKITTIQNPVKIFGKVVKKMPVVEYRYIIEDWKRFLSQQVT